MLDKCGDVIETNVSLLVMALQELKQTEPITMRMGQCTSYETLLKQYLHTVGTNELFYMQFKQ
jgi:hypothetical protein